MAYKSSRVKEHVMLPSDSAYNTLKTTGSYTDPDTGTTITYNEDTIYLTPTSGVGGGGLDANTAVITNAAGELINSGVTSTELSFVAQARSNLQKQIDDLKSQIGTGSGNYFADTFDEIDYTKPGNWYIPNGDGTYFHGVVDDAGNFRPVQARVDPADIGQQDLSAYQKKSDPSIIVKGTDGVQKASVVGALNALDGKTGNSWPLATISQDLSSAINELAGRGGGDTTVVGGTQINVTSPTYGTYAINHGPQGTGMYQYGSVPSSGSANLPIITSDNNGHILTSSTSRTFYIPSTQGYNGQVWTWDAVNQRGYWATPTGGGGSTYTADNGIKIDGTVIRHEYNDRGGQIGDYSTAIAITADQQGHVANLRATIGTTSQYMDGTMKWHNPKSTADQILSGTANIDLVNAASVYDIMGGLRLKKCTQAQYDALGTKDPNTVYIIVG